MSAPEILQKIRDEYLAKINSQRQQNFFAEKPREVYKKKKREKEKYCSRETSVREDQDLGKVSGETCSLASYEPSSLGFASSSLLGNTESSQETGVVAQEEGVSVTPARENLDLALSGIIAQHVQTKSGIKISLTIQTPRDRARAEFVNVTAELKRRERIRELKPYIHDSAVFDDIYQSALQEIRLSRNNSIAVGRVHQRGKRTQWLSDMAVVATLDESGVVKNIILLAGTEEYLIELTDLLSPKQRNSYHSSGTYGEILMHTQAPTLASMPRSRL